MLQTLAAAHWACFIGSCCWRPHFPHLLRCERGKRGAFFRLTTQQCHRCQYSQEWTAQRIHQERPNISPGSPSQTLQASLSTLDVCDNTCRRKLKQFGWFSEAWAAAPVVYCHRLTEIRWRRRFSGGLLCTSSKVTKTKVNIYTAARLQSGSVLLLSPSRWTLFEDFSPSHWANWLKENTQDTWTTYTTTFKYLQITSNYITDG